MTGLPRRVLTINSGSSSIKFSVMEGDADPGVVSSGQAERIGGAARFRARWADASQVIDEPIVAANHADAVAKLLAFLQSEVRLSTIAAVGHRVVHGGPNYVDSRLLDAATLAGLREIVPLAPNHLPGEIAAIEATFAQLSGVPQFACFDTAFHRSLPAVARRFALPRRFDDIGLRRYGFHGLSYQYLLGELQRQAGAVPARGRVVLAHLGAGCSLAAVKNGVCIETTMGFTPTAGLMMATRTGDLDPSAVIHLLRHEKLSADQLEKLVNYQSGLLGVSETSADVRDLLAAERSDPRAAEALEMFCYTARGWIARMAAALEGLDTIVFSAGIGENSPVIRSRICQSLDWLGVRLDESRNAASDPLISSDDSEVAVRVIRTNEERMIFAEVTRLLSQSP